MIQVGDIVMARVTRISTRQASVEIICVGETVLREPHRGIVKKEVGQSLMPLPPLRPYGATDTEPEKSVFYECGTVLY